MTDNTSVHVFPMGDELYCATEVPLLNRIDPSTLDVKQQVCIEYPFLYTRRSFLFSVFCPSKSFIEKIELNFNLNRFEQRFWKLFSEKNLEEAEILSYLCLMYCLSRNYIVIGNISEFSKRPACVIYL